MTFPLSLKLFVPGYRAKWRWRYAAMLSELAALMPHLNYGESEGVPWIELAGGPRLHGFWTEPDNRDVCRILAPDLPPGLPVGHFRLIKDCLNRYVYPHMRPDLKPEGFPPEQMFGFHGQHKDAIADLAGHRPRIRLAGWYRRGGRLIADITREQLERHGYRVIVGSRGNVMALPG